jgi:Putative adhesin
VRRGLVGVGLAMTAVLVGLSSLVAINAMAHQTVQEEHTYGFKGKSVSIELTIGEVQILPSQNDDEISVRRQMSYGLRAPAIEERVDGDTFRVRDGDCAMPVGAPCHVHWLLLVPRHLHLAITTKTGSITVRGMAGPVNLISTSGKVTARALTGPAVQLLSDHGPVSGMDIRSTHVVATSQTGHISLTFRTPPKLARAHTKSGSVAVVLPEGSESYEVRAVAGPGSVKTIAANQDDNANRRIDVKSEEGPVSVEQSTANPSP